MIHTDGHATIVSRGDCPGCNTTTDQQRAIELLSRMDRGVLTESECLEAFALAQRSSIELEPRHQRILDALIYAGYVDPDGIILCQMI